MPAKSKKQQIAMAIAEHHPEETFERNKGMLQMSHQQLHDFASTPRKGLPYSAATPKKNNVNNPYHSSDSHTAGCNPVVSLSQTGLESFGIILVIIIIIVLLRLV